METLTKKRNNSTNSQEGETDGDSTKYVVQKKICRSSWKNIVAISFSFTLTYVSYTGLFALQSSLHVQQGMGVICTSLRYVVLVVLSLFLPELLIRILGHKWTISVSLMSFVLWIAANGYGIWATMVPASILNGVFVGPLWAAQGSYFTECAKEYAIHTKQSHEGVMSLFFGLFYAFYLCATIFGSIISTTILKQSPPENYTALPDKDVEQYCGTSDCPWTEFNNTNEDKPADAILWTLVGVYSTMGISAVLLSIFAVDNLPKHVVKKGKQRTLKQLLASTFRLMKRRELWLLVPLTVYTGLEETFFFAEYNLSWVSCALGIWMIGFVNIPFGITSSVMSYSCGFLSNKIGRVPVMCIALAMDASIQLTLAFWTPVSPTNETSWLYYFVPFIWGAYHGIWLTVVTSLYGIIFPGETEAAYSAFMSFQCLGYALAFGYSFFICTSTKLYIMFGLLVVSIVSYFVLEIQEKCKKKNVILKDASQETTDENIPIKVSDTYTHYG